MPRRAPTQLKKDAAAAKKRAERLGYFIEAVLREAGGDLSKTCRELLERREHALQVRRDVGALSPQDEAQENALHSLIRSSIATMLGSEDHVDSLKKQTETASSEAKQAEEQYLFAMSNARSFAEAAFVGNSFQALLCRGIIMN